MAFGAFSSSSKTKVDTTSQAYNTGFSEIAGPATSVNFSLVGTRIGKKATFAPTIALTDHGALARANEIAGASLFQVQNAVGALGGFFTQALGAVSASQSQAVEAVSSSNRTETENLGLAALKWGALAFGAYALARIFWKKG